MPRIQTGGELVSQGTYGCVFRPALQCPDDTKSPKDTVSKVMLTREAEKEMAENNAINAIDSRNIYHLPPPKMCDFLGRHYMEPGMDDCNAIKRDSTDTVSLLQYKDGGKSLDLFLNYDFFSKMKGLYQYKFLYRFYYLIYGLNEMNENNYIHNDIKLQNIVINEDTLKMNYIDFGLASTFATLLKNPYKRYMFGYFAYPAETLLLVPTVFNSIKSGKHVYSFKSMKNYYNQSYAPTVDKYYVKNGSLYAPTWSEELQSKYIEDIKGTTYKDFSNEMIKSIDVFSLGLVLLQCYIFMNRGRYNISEKPMQSELLSYTYSLISFMTKPYYKDRFTAAQCLDYYETNILPLVGGKKYVKEKELIRKPVLAPPPTSLKEIIKEIGPIKKPRHALVGREVIKICPEGKILNPPTQRCVNKDGPTGRKLMKAAGIGVVKPLKMSGRTMKKASKQVDSDRTVSRKSVKASPPKKRTQQPKKRTQTVKSIKSKQCPEGKILNPVTRRCVNKDGVTGRKLLKPRRIGKITRKKKLVLVDSDKTLSR